MDVCNRVRRRIDIHVLTFHANSRHPALSLPQLQPVGSSKVSGPCRSPAQGARKGRQLAASRQLLPFLLVEDGALEMEYGAR